MAPFFVFVEALMYFGALKSLQRAAGPQIRENMRAAKTQARAAKAL
jgi:hypothetical protein